MSKDTPGAIEAAEIISDLVSDRRADWCVGDLAEIIDRETAAPKLLEACEALILAYESFVDFDADEPGENAGVDACRAASEQALAAIAANAKATKSMARRAKRAARRTR